MGCRYIALEAWQLNDNAGCEMAERFELSIAWRRLAG